MTHMYGLEYSNKDFDDDESYGKNTFTNAFPVSLVNYMHAEKDLPMNYIVAELDQNSIPTTRHVKRSLPELIGIEPSRAFYAFEDSFAGYDHYAVEHANPSDVVVRDRFTGAEVSAFEVKLVVVPTSGTANRPRPQQLCELVVRPPSVEQLCFSVAASFGIAEQLKLRDIIVAALGNPMDYDWNNKTFMLAHRRQVIEAVDEITRQGLDRQTPFSIMAEWRTIGQGTDFDDKCFDVFFWSNFAFLQLFVNVARNALDRNLTTIGRPERSLIWFLKSMFDYTAQGAVMFERTRSQITFSGQTDKAGSFTNANISKFVLTDDFVYPRISADEWEDVIDETGVRMLKPERRLDAVLTHIVVSR